METSSRRGRNGSSYRSHSSSTSSSRSGASFKRSHNTRTGTRTAISNSNGSGGSFKRTPSKHRTRFGSTHNSHARTTSGRSGGSRSNSRRGGQRGGGRKMPTFDPSQFINTNPVSVVEEVYTPVHTFDTFGLSTILSDNVRKLGITVPSPIQDQIIPEILNGNDVIGLAETGTGKTAAFLLPLIEKTLHDANRQTLILTPTRELALQIETEMHRLSRGCNLSSVTCVGGVNIRPQIKALHRKNHFVIGTPGRVLDLINRKNFNAHNVTTVVLDEADRMLDMGFIGDIKKIVGATPKERETLFFSATIDNSTKGLVSEFLRNPVTVSVKKKDVTDSIAQDIVPYAHDAKFETLIKLFENPDFKRVIIFGAMKHSVKRLAEDLSKRGIVADSLHGNKSHSQRQRSLNKFKSGNARVMVATDVAARGIHVDNVSHVINYDLPNTFEDYVHRIGRTGRGDQRGQALTFVPAQ